MDPPNVLAVPDERRGGPYLRRYGDLAEKPSWRSSWPLAPWQQFRKHSLGRSHRPARVAASGPGQKAAGAISLAEIPAPPRVGRIRRQIDPDAERLRMDSMCPV